MASGAPRLRRVCRWQVCPVLPVPPCVPAVRALAARPGWQDACSCMRLVRLGRRDASGMAGLSAAHLPRRPLFLRAWQEDGARLCLTPLRRIPIRSVNSLRRGGPAAPACGLYLSAAFQEPDAGACTHPCVRLRAGAAGWGGAVAAAVPCPCFSGLEESLPGVMALPASGGGSMASSVCCSRTVRRPGASGRTRPAAGSAGFPRVQPF